MLVSPGLGASVFLEVFLREAIESKRSDCALEAGRGEAPFAVGEPVKRSSSTQIMRFCMGNFPCFWIADNEEQVRVLARELLRLAAENFARSRRS